MRIKVNAKIVDPEGYVFYPGEVYEAVHDFGDSVIVLKDGNEVPLFEEEYTILNATNQEVIQHILDILIAEGFDVEKKANVRTEFGWRLSPGWQIGVPSRGRTQLVSDDSKQLSFQDSIKGLIEELRRESIGKSKS